MAFLSAFSRPPSPRLVAPLGASVMRQCYPQLCGMVGPAVLAMGPAEARGYVQAFTGHVIRCTIDEFVDRYDLDSRLRPPLFQFVLDAVLDRALADLTATSHRFAQLRHVA